MQQTSQQHPITTPPRNVLPSRALQETCSDTPLRPLGPEKRRERNESPYPQVDTRHERTHAGQGDRVASVLPPSKPPTTYPPPSATKPSATYPPPSTTKPSAPSSPPLKRPSASASYLSPPTGTPPSIQCTSASTSPTSSPPAPSLAKSIPGQMNAPWGALQSDPQAPYRGATFESPHLPSMDRGLVSPRADEQGRGKDPSAASHRPPATLEYTPATTESPRQVHKDAYAASHTTSIHTEHSPTVTERPSRQDRKEPPAVPITSHVPDITQHQGAPTEGSIQRTCSYHGFEPSTSHLPDKGYSRTKTGQPLNPAPPRDRRETPITPMLVFTQNQPTHLIRQTSLSHTNSTSSTKHLSQPPSHPADSQTHLTSNKSSIFLANLD